VLWLAQLAGRERLAREILSATLLTKQPAFTLNNYWPEPL
jgi:hypothetical protein